MMMTRNTTGKSSYQAFMFGLVQKLFQRKSARRISSLRRIFLECLVPRLLMAVDLEVPPAIVAQFPAELKVVDDSSGVGIGSLVKSLEQTQLSVIHQSEAVNGVLYTVGQDDGNSTFLATNLGTGVTQKVTLSALLSGSTSGAIVGVENSLSGGLVFVGNSQYNLQAAGAPTKWDAVGSPTAVQLPAGTSSPAGTVFTVSANGFVGGRTSSSGAFIATNQGSFNLPKNQTGVLSTVLSMSDTGRFAVGGIGGENAVWKAIGNPEEGKYELLNFTWEIPDEAQGILPMYIVLENSTHGGLGMSQYVNENGENVAGIWSLTDGSLLQDFGPNSGIADAKVINGQTVIALNGPSSSSVLIPESGKIYDLRVLLETTTTVSFSPGAIFTDTVDGKTTIGFSYFENNALKAAVFEFAAPTADLAWDFTKDGTVDLTETAVPLPDLTSHVYKKLGQTTVQVTVTIDGVPTTIEKTVNVVSLAVVDGNLLIGGDEGADVVKIEKLPDGGLKVTVNDVDTSFAAGAVDQIFANLGGGDNHLTVDGAIPLSALNLTHVSKLSLSNGASLSGLTPAAAQQMGTKLEEGEEPRLVLEVPPMYLPVNPVALSSDWKYGSLVTANGLISHTLSGGGIQIIVRNGVYQNPLDRLDVNGDGRITPTDALLVIGVLNLRIRDSSEPQNDNVNVNGDSRNSAIDALLVISKLNQRPRGGGEGEGASSLASDNTAADTPTGWFYSVDDSIEPASSKRRTLQKMFLVHNG